MKIQTSIISAVQVIKVGMVKSRSLFETYDKILAYANPDSLGLDVDNALTRFVGRRRFAW